MANRFWIWLALITNVRCSLLLPPDHSLDPRSDFLGALGQLQLGPALSKQLTSNLPAIDHWLSEAAQTTQQKSTSACNILASVLPDRTITVENQTSYDAAESINWAENCRLPAQCFVAPSTTAETQLVLKVVTFLGSTFAIRSGGHNPNPGFASVAAPGVLIDLKNLRSLSLSPDGSILYSGSGNRGQDLQSFTDPHNISTVFGVNLVVGSSGLTLGGGYPILSSATGLAADNVQNFEVVLANSSVVNASSQSHQDLWRSLRGGGNNFGIVTRLDRYTSKVHNIWYSIVNYSSSDYEAFDLAMSQVQQNMQSDSKANAYVTASITQISVVFAYAEPIDSPAVFTPFKALTPLDVQVPPTNGTIYSLAQIMSTPDRTLNYQTASIITQVDASFYDKVWKRYFMHTPFRNGTAVSIAFKPFDPAAIAYDMARNYGLQNIMGHANVSQIWFGLAGGWADSADAAYIQGILQDMNDYMVSMAQSMGIYLPNLFTNDAGPIQNVMASYGATNLEFMKRVSQQYDPEQAFQTLQNGGYLVSRA